MEAERRVLAGPDDDPELGGTPGEQELQLCHRRGVEQLVQVVDDEHDGRIERAGAGHDPLDDLGPVQARGRDHVVERAVDVRVPQRPDERQQEAPAVAFLALDRDPRRPIGDPGRREPGPDRARSCRCPPARTRG